MFKKYIPCCSIVCEAGSGTTGSMMLEGSGSNRGRFLGLLRAGVVLGLLQTCGAKFNDGTLPLINLKCNVYGASFLRKLMRQI